MYNIQLSLYIHFPWCVKKCPYCDFNSFPIAYDIHNAFSYSHDIFRHSREGGNPEEPHYTEALIKDFDSELSSIQNRVLNSIFLGGGTPSLFSSQSIQQLLEAIKKRIKLKTNIEITIESNPGTIDREKLVGFRKAGINRLSIGVQSFQDEKLKQLGRIHSVKETDFAIESAKQAGFENINVDLMYGLPHQTVEDALFDLEAAIQHQPEHISWYQLTIEPETPFGQNPPLLPDEEIILTIEEKGRALLESHGYHRYEISAYAKPGFQCQHNLNYWQYGDYVGIGAGAHGKLTEVDIFAQAGIQPHIITRTQKAKFPQDYLTGKFLADIQILESDEIPLDFMMNVSRLIEGVPTKIFQERTGLPLNVIQEKIKKARKTGFLVNIENIIQSTPLGLQFLNEWL